jgi:hypothetical protein
MQNPDASCLHAIGSMALSNKFEDMKMKWWQADLLTLSIGAAWELKDAIMPYEHFGIIGGEGFSRNDLLCDFYGVLANRAWKLIIKRLF